MKKFITLTTVLAALITGLAVAGDSPAPADAKVYVIWPTDGTIIEGGKFWVRFGLRGMGVAPAGVDKEFTGHHHLIIDAPLPRMDEEIPADNNHLHFGKGQTEARITLEPGTHTLQLVLGDHNHLPHNPPMVSQKITITVK